MLRLTENTIVAMDAIPGTNDFTMQVKAGITPEQVDNAIQRLHALKEKLWSNAPENALLLMDQSGGIVRKHVLSAEPFVVSGRFV